ILCQLDPARDPAVLPILAGGLKSMHEPVFFQAAEALGLLGLRARAAEERLIDLVLQGGQSARPAARALSSIGVTRWDLLRGGLESAPDLAATLRAVKELGPAAASLLAQV